MALEQLTFLQMMRERSICALSISLLHFRLKFSAAVQRDCSCLAVAVASHASLPCTVLPSIPYCVGHLMGHCHFDVHKRDDKDGGVGNALQLGCLLSMQALYVHDMLHPRCEPIAVNSKWLET